MAVLTASCARIFFIAQNTAREAARQKLFSFVLILAFALVLGARWFRDFNFGAPELKFLADCGFGAMAFFGSALTIVATAQLFYSEIESRTALTLLAKPVYRGEFILGKFLGILAVIGVFCGGLTLLLLAVLWRRESELMADFPDAFRNGRTIDFGTVVIAGGLQWVKLAVLAAFTLLVASFAQTQLFAVVMGFLVLVICHLQYLAQDAYARSGTWLGRVGGAALAAVFPNFQLFALAESLAPADAPAWGEVVRVLAYGGGYVIVGCALAIFSFRHREI